MQNLPFLELKDAVVTAIGYVGSTPKGLVLIDATKDLFSEYIYNVHREDELRITTLHSIAYLLTNISK